MKIKNVIINSEDVSNGDHYIEKELNNNGEKITSYGIDSNEECKIICLNCKTKLL